MHIKCGNKLLNLLYCTTEKVVANNEAVNWVQNIFIAIVLTFDRENAKKSISFALIVT
jgi:hypothetical protein